MGKLLYEDLTYKIGAAKQVYKELGPGFSESVYEDALCYELDNLGISYESQVELDVSYKNAVFKIRFRADLIVEGRVLVENKAIKMTTPVDEAQLINYLATTGLKVGLLFNFGGDRFEMIRRIK
ncbi:GxxExxY protein [bacterium]|nr:GxxExxY protein [bacterium]